MGSSFKKIDTGIPREAGVQRRRGGGALKKREIGRLRKTCETGERKNRMRR